jgi:hypothetical protein
MRERHDREVMEYFKNREEDLLVLDIAAGEGWEKLCPFPWERNSCCAVPLCEYDVRPGARAQGENEPGFGRHPQNLRAVLGS